jgi:hypothetical protein
MDKLWLGIDMRHDYTCGNCGNVMPTELVANGKLDVKEALTKASKDNLELHNDLETLLSYLQNEHGADYIYRGQIMPWEGILFPSIFRNITSELPLSLFERTQRLRSVGNIFHETKVRVNNSSTQSLFGDQINYQQFLQNLFGYQLGNIFSQQCGINSEGLDVTHDPMVAALFAVFDFNNWKFMEEGIGVIYRFKNITNVDCERDIRKSTFYDVAPYVSSVVTIASANPCDNWQQSLESFQEYAFQQLVNKNEGDTKRPLNILAFPRHEVIHCRVIQQKAGLAFPDYILSKDFNLLNKKPPDGKAERDGVILIEDIAKRDGVECFYFIHSSKSKYIIPLSPNLIFPKEDLLTKLLKSLEIVLPKIIMKTELGIYGINNIGLIK